jgi:hypothetical protein
MVTAVRHQHEIAKVAEYRIVFEIGAPDAGNGPGEYFML